MAHHQHHHNHSHTQGCSGSASSSAGKALAIALVINAGFLVIEATVGWIIGSLALLSDAAHMVSDVAALSVAYLAHRLAKRVGTSTRTFGWMRAEAFGALINALAVLLVVGYIFWEAISRLSAGAPAVAGLPILVVGILGFLINAGSAWVLFRSDRKNLNVRGALIHLFADALGSLGAVGAAILVMFGFVAADAWVSMLIGTLVLWSTWGVLRDSTAVLLQFSPKGVDVESIGEALLACPGAVGLHELHVWSIDGQRTVLSAHLVAAKENVVGSLRRQALALLNERFGLDHLTLQVELAGECDRAKWCPGRSD